MNGRYNRREFLQAGAMATAWAMSGTAFAAEGAGSGATGGATIADGPSL